jgi:hypothetical protein
MIPYNIELTDEEERILDEIWGVTSQQASGPDAAEENAADTSEQAPTNTQDEPTAPAR